MKETLPFVLVNTLLLHIPLLALTDRQNDRETNTLTACGLEKLFFQFCCCVSFSVLAENSIWCYLRT
jgi:hypothetical protein